MTGLRWNTPTSVSISTHRYNLIFRITMENDKQPGRPLDDYSPFNYATNILKTTQLRLRHLLL